MLLINANSKAEYFSIDNILHTLNIDTSNDTYMPIKGLQ